MRQILSMASAALLLLAATDTLEAQKDPKAKAGPALFANRKGEAREAALRDFGGNDKSEEAVANGLKWIANQQIGDGRWNLDKTTTDHSIGATALALLPFLADGKTHKPAKDNPYDKTIAKGLTYLRKSQDQKTGFFGGQMYDHGLATIAICEAYAMTNDPALKLSAQK